MGERESRCSDEPVGDVPFKRETRIVSTHVIATSRGRGEAFKIWSDKTTGSELYLRVYTWLLPAWRANHAGEEVPAWSL